MNTGSEVKTVQNILGAMTLVAELVSPEGEVLASANPERVGFRYPQEFVKNLEDIMDSLWGEKVDEYNDHTIMKLSYHSPNYIVVNGRGQAARDYATVVKTYYERVGRRPLCVDASQALKGIVMEDFNDNEIPELAAKLGIPIKTDRIVYVIRMDETEGGLPLEDMESILKKAFSQDDDVVFSNGSDYLILVKAVENENSLDVNNERNEFYELAEAIGETLLAETSARVVIGVGTTKSDLAALRNSYSEAMQAIEIGSLLNTNHVGSYTPYRIFFYNSILLERFLYEVSPAVKRKYSRMLFDMDEKGVLDTDMLKTLAVFFENNLNISLASRELYIHRNTLLYRLDKIQKVFGLDLRNFHDAATFKIMMLMAGWTLPDKKKLDN